MGDRGHHDAMAISHDGGARSRGRWPLYVLIAVCLAPVAASYVAYYVWQPSARVNYGELLRPQRPLPALDLSELDGTAVDAAILRGRWTMVMANPANCVRSCRDRLWKMRQVRLTQGKDGDRIQRVWFVTDKAPLEILLMREYQGTQFLRADSAQLRRFLPAGDDLTDHIWLIDPLGNLMMRWPKDPDASRMKRDLSRLLKASRIG